MDLVQPEVDPFDPLTKNPHFATKYEVDRITRCADMADFSSRMRISAMFLLPTKVLMTDSESHTLNSDYGSTWLSFQDMGMGQTDRQTPDTRRMTPLLKVSHLLLQAGHLITVLITGPDSMR